MKFLRISKQKAALLAVIMFFIMLMAGVPVLVAAADEGDGEEQLSQNIDDVLEGLDLSELQQYLDENSDSYLFNFGDNAEEIIRYLINGNIGTDYGSYITEILSVVFFRRGFPSSRFCGGGGDIAAVRRVFRG